VNKINEAKLRFTDTELVVIKTIKQHGRCWIIGGTIRDLLLGVNPTDLDLATDLLPTDVMELLRKTDVDIIPDSVALIHGVVRIAVDDGTIDIATLRNDIECDGRHAQIQFTNSIEEDLLRRDLTINAMAMEILDDNCTSFSDVIDPTDGQDDIHRKKILFVRDPVERIAEDALRMIRACRFTALGLDWTLDETTIKAIQDNLDKVSKVSVERVRNEILKAMAYDIPGNFIRALNTCNLLSILIKPVHACIGVEQNEHHAENVYEHLLDSLDACSILDSRPLLRLTALLHDIGKPRTTSIDSIGHIHFYKHEVAGEHIAYTWMKELRFSNNDIQYVTNLIAHHQWRFYTDTRDSTIRTWLRNVGENWQDLITLRSADRQGNRLKKDKGIVTPQTLSLISRLEGILSKKAPIFDGDLAIDGHDIEDLGIKPGPLYKEIYSVIWGIVIQDPSRNNREYLLKYIRRNYDRQ
jgi:tRNA nucleotidyltransferase (CCA-adding enzyme)